ncbi:unnamed protein product [Alopecurus aequalis]
MNDGAELVSRYIAGRRSRDVGSSEMRMEEDHLQEDEEHIAFEEDEDDEDEDYGLDDHDEEDIGEGSSTDAQGRQFRSKAWREFEPIHVDGEVTKGECKHCKAVISAKRGHGTSGLRNHLNRCKDRARMVGALNQMNATLMTPEGVSRLWKWDPDVARKALVRMVVLHEFPLSIVEYDGFRKFVKSLNLSFNMISRRTLKNDITKEFDDLKNNLKELFGASKYPQVFGNTASTKLATLKQVFKELFDEYAKVKLSERTQTQQEVEDMDMESNDPLSDWDRHLSIRINSTSVGSSELDAYWLKPPLARTDKFDILAWWKANSIEYPILASMARDVLAVPASTVASESAFSTGRRVISDFRSRLTPNTVESLICLQDWFRTSSTSDLSTASVYDILGYEGLSILQDVE